MFFKGHGDGHRKKSPIANLGRIIISLLVFAVLAIGLLKAYQSFAGIDPLKVDPKAILRSLITSEETYNLIIGMLELSPDKSLERTKALITNQPLPKDEVGSDTTFKPNAPLSYRFAVIADSHKDTGNLTKALYIAKERGVKFIVGIGDFSDVGTFDELKAIKMQFDTSGLPYYVTAGDHDLWESREKNLGADANFKQVFGSTYQAFSYANTRIILFYNADNYLGLDGLQLKWIEDEIGNLKNTNAKLVFAVSSTPLYHPSSDHFMGKVTPKLKDQAEHLISIFKKGGVDEVIFADTHFFSRYKEPKNDLKMTTVGAVTSVRNPQTPRFAVVDVYEDGGYNIVETEVK